VVVVDDTCFALIVGVFFGIRAWTELELVLVGCDILRRVLLALFGFLLMSESVCACGTNWQV
jgi:hypothetical protein